MIRVDLEDAFRLDGFPCRCGVEHALHLEGQAALCGQADRVLRQTVGELDLADFVTKRCLDGCQQILVLFFLLLQRFLGCLILLRRRVILLDGQEGFLLVAADSLEDEFVDVVGHVEDLRALLFQRLGTRHAVDVFDAVAGRIVDVRLVFRHALDVFRQRDHLLLAGRIVHHEVFKVALVKTEVLIHAILELQTEVLVERFVPFAVVLEEIREFVADLAGDVLGNVLELAVVLQHLTADVERQILAVDEAADKAEVVRHEFFAAIHDQHAGAVQLQALLEVARVVVERRLLRDEHQRGEAADTFDARVDDARRVFRVVELAFVE